MIEKNNDWFLKLFLVGIFALLLFISYQLYTRNTSTPSTEMDCLKLGSNERASACLKLLKKPTVEHNFPLHNLTIADIKATKNDYCVEVVGTIENDYSLPAKNITLRIDFTKTQNSESFHYEVFSPFLNSQEQVQPGSSKTFTQCLSYQSFQAVKEVNNWYFLIQPFEAKIAE